MGVGSGAGSKEKRKKLKKAAKESRKAEYLAKIREDMNKKAKGAFTRKGAVRLVKDFKHETNFCGNVACKRCFPVLHAKLDALKNRQSIL
jgi:hypothetical protein